MEGNKKKQSYLFGRVDGASLACFRIMWGLVMTYEAWTFLVNNGRKSKAQFYSSKFRAKYYGFEWSDRYDDFDMTMLHLRALFVSGVFITFGFLYHLSSLAYLVLFTLLYSWDMTYYLNHFYFLLIVQLYLTCFPAARVWSIDNLLSRYIFFRGREHDSTIPRWMILALQLQLVIIYMYAGVMKLNEDWLRGEPLRHWFASRDQLPFFGPMFRTKLAPFFLSYSGMLIDLLMPLLLLFRSTAALGTFFLFLFHMLNKIFMNIGIFPAMSVLTCTVFWSPSWPRFPARFFEFLASQAPSAPRMSTQFLRSPAHTAPSKAHYLLFAFFAAFLAVQAVFPMRHMLYSGSVAWNEYGHLFSWRMKLREKTCDLRFFYWNETQRLFYEFDDFSYSPNAPATPRQIKKISARPDGMLQFAQFLSKNFLDGAPVHVHSHCMLNYRRPGLFINETYDLTKEKLWAWPYKFVTDAPPPLTEEETALYPWNWRWECLWKEGCDVIPDAPKAAVDDYGDNLLIPVVESTLH